MNIFMLWSVYYARGDQYKNKFFPRSFTEYIWINTQNWCVTVVFDSWALNGVKFSGDRELFPTRASLPVDCCEIFSKLHYKICVLTLCKWRHKTESAPTAEVLSVPFQLTPTQMKTANFCRIHSEVLLCLRRLHRSHNVCTKVVYFI